MVFPCGSISIKEEEIEQTTRTHTKSSSTRTTYHTASSDLNSASNSAEKQSNMRVFTLAELRAATNNFCRSSNIGEGGFGSVYKGVVKSQEHPFSEVTVAVKHGNGLSQGYKEWETEVNFLGVVKHPNLVKLIGYCTEKGELGTHLFLVYEYMSNGSLRDHLSSRSKAPLPWKMRLKVAQHAACGLTYLHEDMNFQIILRDLKSSNILLDDQWNAKLSDFGVARLGPEEGLTHISTTFAGTKEYAAPEYLELGRLTTKCDVWSYGVFLYNLITGKPSLDSRREHLERIIPYLDTKRYMLTIDPRLKGKYSRKSAQKLFDIAKLCLAKDPKLRPKMSEVLEMVTKLVKVPSQATTPASPQVLEEPKKVHLDQPTQGKKTNDDTKHEDETRSTHKESGRHPRTRPLKLLKCCFK